MGMLLDQDEAGRCDPCFFNDARNHAYSVGASGSSGGEQHHLHAFILEPSRDLGAGVFYDIGNVS